MGTEAMQAHRLLGHCEDREECAHDAGVPACFHCPGLRLAVTQDRRPVASGGQAAGKEGAL